MSTHAVHRNRQDGAGKVRKGRPSPPRKLVAGLTAILLGAGFLPVVGAPAAGAAPVGQGLTLNAGDMRFILKQIKIAENHATKEDAQGNPVAGQPLVGSGPNQIANALLPFGLRSVDGTENNLIPDQGSYGSASRVMPRLAPAEWRAADLIAPNGTPLGEGSYKSVNTNLSDAEPRFVSNVIVDQTDTNPAAIAAAGKAHRTVNDEPTAVPCGADGLPLNCVPKGETLDIPNITTDFGLSPPYNGMFALFGQFFDHGVDFTKKTKNFVMVPLAADDPLVLEGKGPANQPFMILNRAENQPGPDGVLGTGDDVQDATNTDSPWVDQSQTYGSHSSQQVFLRKYVMVDGKPVSNGELIEGTAEGMANWADIKNQAATLLGLRLSDSDISNIPMLATDQYGRFLRGPNGLPQYVTSDNRLSKETSPPPWHRRQTSSGSASPSSTTSPTTPPRSAARGTALTPDTDTTAGTPTSVMAAGTYDDEMLDQHFIAGDGRVNENIGLTAIHQVFHSEHNRLATYMEELITSLNLDLNEWQLPRAYGTVNACSRRPVSSPRWNTSTSSSRTLLARSSRASTRSTSSPSRTPASTRPSKPSSPMQPTASGTRCSPTWWTGRTTAEPISAFRCLTHS